MATIRNLTGAPIVVANLAGDTVQAHLPADAVVVSMSDTAQDQQFAGVDVRTHRMKHAVQNLPSQVAQVGLVIPRHILHALADRGQNRADLMMPGSHEVVIGEEVCCCGLVRLLD